MVDTVVMIPLDSQVTTIDFSNQIEVTRGSVINDADGARQATLMFEQGTTATMVLPDGSTQPLTSFNVRATEFTVGADGANAMPALLPSVSAYTYCVELSLDEAIAAGATKVQFSPPVPFYVENFINFPVGTIVPAGYYERAQGVWLPSNSGRVIKILGVINGLAQIDANGDAIADHDTTLACLGFTTAERQQLASTYATGQSLWRIEIPHFSKWDINGE